MGKTKRPREVKNPKETQKTKEAFDIYYETKNKEEVARRLGVSSVTVTKWAQCHNWDKKCERKDELAEMEWVRNMSKLQMQRARVHLDRLEKVQTVGMDALGKGKDELEAYPGGLLALKAIAQEREVLAVKGQAPGDYINTQNNLIVTDIGDDRRNRLRSAIHGKLASLKLDTGRRKSQT